MKTSRILLLVAQVSAVLFMAATYKITLPANTTIKPGDVISVEVESTTTPTTPPQPTVVDSRIGLNLEIPAHYARSQYFGDIAKSAQLYSGNPKTGESKWRVLTFTDHLNVPGSLEPANVLGDYTIVASGGGTITCTGATLIGNTLRVSQIGNVDVIFSAPVTSFAIYRPGYNASSGTFTTQFKNDTAPFAGFRFMDWQQTNMPDMTARKALLGTNAKLDWSERPKTTDYVWNGPLGVPLEVCVDLCNQTKHYGHFQIPFDASDDWIRNFFLLIRDTYDNTLPFYWGFSNELWNSQFPQYGLLKTETQAYLAANTAPSLLPTSQAGNIDYLMRHYTLKRLLDSVAIARTIFPASDMLTRCRPVFEDQYPSYGLTVDALYWAKTAFGKVDIWGIYIAPYYGVGDENTINAVGVDGVFANINKQIADRESWTSPGLAYWRSIADAYDLRLGVYECGIDHGKRVDAASVLNAVAYDTRSKDVTIRYLNQLAFYCDAPINYFRYCGINDGREYGLTDNGAITLADGKTKAAGPRPKYDGAVSVCTTPVPSTMNKGLTWTITIGTKTITDIRGGFCAYHNWWTGGPFYDTGAQAIEMNNFKATITGKYVPSAGVVGLAMLVDANDSATLSAPNTFTAGVPVDIKITYAAERSGSGDAMLRLLEVFADGSKRMVPLSSLLPN